MLESLSVLGILSYWLGISVARLRRLFHEYLRWRSLLTFLWRDDAHHSLPLSFRCPHIQLEARQYSSFSLIFTSIVIYIITFYSHFLVSIFSLKTWLLKPPLRLFIFLSRWCLYIYSTYSSSLQLWPLASFHNVCLDISHYYGINIFGVITVQHCTVIWHFLLSSSQTLLHGQAFKIMLSLRSLHLLHDMLSSLRFIYWDTLKYSSRVYIIYLLDIYCSAQSHNIWRFSFIYELSSLHYFCW